jgi:hypothetical protein
MSFLRLAVLILTITVASSSLANNEPAMSWDKLKGLVGTWRLVDSKTPSDQAFRITFRLISANTALVESFGDPSKQVTETVYHLDGQRLLATHYCAQGNQPRLQLQPPSSTGSLEFQFLDATNLKRITDSHLIRLRFEFVDSRHLIRHEVYAENGHNDESTLSLEKVD